MATTYDFSASVREQKGSGRVGQIRRQGLIPGVIYTKEGENLSIQFSAKDLSELLKQVPSTSILLNLDIDGAGKKEVFVQAVQKHNINGNIIHIDFLEVDADKVITPNLPLVLTGEPKGVAVGGLLTQLKYSLSIKCLPKDLPETISVDVSHLDVSQSMMIHEVTFPEGCTPVLNDRVVIALVAKTRAAQAAAASGGE